MHKIFVLFIFRTFLTFFKGDVIDVQITQDQLTLRWLPSSGKILNQGVNIFLNVRTFCVGIALKILRQSFKGSEEPLKTPVF